MATKKSTNDTGTPTRLLMRWAGHHDPHKGGPTPLHTAAFKGELKEVKKLLETGSDINILDAKGWTPLHDAAIQGHTDIVKLLIAAGADINVQDNEERYTPLHDAARMNYLELKELLLTAGANTRLKDKCGSTPEEIEEG